MRKNVLIFGHGYANGFIEATNQYIQLFDPKQYNVYVVYLDGEPSQEIIDRHLTTNILFLNTPAKHKRGLKWQSIKKMLLWHKEKNFHIVICHRYKPAYIMLCVSRFKKIPALFCVMHEMKTLQSLARKWFIKFIAQDNVIFAGVSNAVRNDLRRNITSIPTKRVITLYNMIDIQRTEIELLSRKAARDKLSIPDNAFVFGILGRLVPAKDHKTLINAFAIAKPYCPNAKLIIIGEGECEVLLQKQIDDLNLHQDVRLTGFLPNAIGLLTAFDTFMLSSIKEAFGRVLIEAMVAKIPIIATITDGIPEVVADAGTLVEKSNPNELAKAMQYHYNMTNEKWIECSKKSYQRAVDTFSLEQFKKTFWETAMVEIN